MTSSRCLPFLSEVLKKIMSAGTRWFYKERQKEKHNFNFLLPHSSSTSRQESKTFRLYIYHITNSQSVKIIGPPANHPVVASTGAWPVLHSVWPSPSVRADRFTLQSIQTASQIPNECLVKWSVGHSLTLMNKSLRWFGIEWIKKKEKRNKLQLLSNFCKDNMCDSSIICAEN